MLYTYDIIDIKTRETIAKNIPSRKVREVLGSSINVPHYAEDLVLYKGRYRISRNQVIKESADEIFSQEWKQAAKKCKKYPHLSKIQIVPDKK